MYYIVKCSRCGTFRYIKAGVKTFTCMKCGKRSVVENTLVFTTAETVEEARDLVVKFNSRRHVESIDSYDGDFSSSIFSPKMPREGKMRAIKRCLYRLSESGRFTAEDLKKALQEEGFDIPMEKIEEIIYNLLNDGYLYEPEPGRYSVI